MMHAEPMSKVTIIGPKSYQEKIISAMYDLNVYHIKEHHRDEQLDIGRPLAKAERLSEILVKIRGVLSALDIKEDHAQVQHIKTPSEKDFFDLGKKSKQLFDEVNSVVERLKVLDEQHNVVTNTLSTLHVLDTMRDSFEELRPSNYLSLATGKIAKGKATQLALDIKKIAPHHSLATAETKGATKIALFYSQQMHEKVIAALQQYQFREQDISSVKDMKGTPALMIQQQEAVSKKITQEQIALRKRPEGMRHEHTHFLLLNEKLLHEELRKAEAPLKFGESREFFTVEGFVPKKEVLAFTQEITRVAKDTVHFEINGMDKDKEIPIKLDNPKAVQPFEFFLDMYSLPSYKEFDPSMLMFITFPLFFGMMLGDIGYGLTTLLLFLFLKKKMPSAKQLLNIMILASIVSIAFGFAFGEFFGFEHVSESSGEKLCAMGVCLPKATLTENGVQESVYAFPHLMSRFKDSSSVFGYSLPTILVVGIIVGIIHVNLAILMGFLNVLFAHGLWHAIEEKFSWFILEAGIIVLAAWNTWIGAAIMVLALVLVYMGEGVQGLIEAPALLTNILSYMRIGAVGLAGVGLAIVINEKFVLPNIAKGGVMLIVGIIIMILGHAINIALGIMGPFLHALRLHYVEFFSRFYKGGGIKYVPFGYNHETE